MSLWTECYLKHGFLFGVFGLRVNNLSGIAKHINFVIFFLYNFDLLISLSAILVQVLKTKNV